ncbi:tripartite tricarboxylate transporter substrate binding protein [Comamonas thiooxydans]|uniref:Bug family tripartite tricarboxylate transporter substrate binding protein n=1 Tax=Comamonas thiooxydans TaxID=363952 RepID=UPI00244A7FD3|nr:tripartite tricarboxylate transporter substrate binding protein [Comamonas thiooxydans]MDH1475213.1 tripartite tricarboxylate transporter substrate binding protein [Comamonas thiooxydans]
MSNQRTFRIKFLPAIAVAAVLSSTGAIAQSFPSKPITLIVPFPAGGTTDVLARSLGERLSRSWGQPVIVDNRPGVGATLGASMVAKSKPDGYTLLIGAVHHTIATSVYPKLNYDFQKDFAPITVIAMVPNVLVINPRVPAKNLADLVALAKSQPGKLSYGSNGNGTAQHLIGTQFTNMTGTQILHVPYKGSGPLATDLLGGQISMSFDTITPVLSHIKAGKLTALAVTTDKRSPALPDVPTLDEAGLKGFNLGTWFGVLAPAATPKDVVSKLNAEMVKIIHSPEFRQKMEEIGADPIGNSPEQMAKQIGEETQKFSKLVKEGKVAIE